MNRVFVTGMGVISALGEGVKDNLQALLDGKSGIKPIANLDSIHKGKLPAAEIDFSNEELVERIPNFDKTKPYTRGQLLSIIAVNEAVEQAGLTEKDLLDLPIIGANTVGGMDFSEIYYNTHTSIDSYYFNEAHPGGETTRKIADYLHSTGFISTINTACSSSANAIMLGTRLIKSGRAKRVLVGGSDPLTKFSLNGFSSLMIYDNEACKPFDARRNGLNLGEAGAFLVLESEEVCKNKIRVAEVLGYANKNDAFHSSASSPDGEGAFLSMRKALETANISADKVDFVHAHGTATPNNDETESIALKRLFGDKIPFFASSKSYVGHTIGAAGAINSIYAILAMNNSFVFKNLNYKHSSEDIISPVSKLIRGLDIDVVMSNAFGFGGNNTSLVFGKIGKGEEVA
jgi:3-oxoacyl-[acyl-carrier-protein] synthase-1